jgi:hypothetical protein
MRQRGWFVEMIRIQGRKEYETERLVRGDDANTISDSKMRQKGWFVELMRILLQKEMLLP